MTDEEKEIERGHKRRLVEELETIRHRFTTDYAYALGGTDPRLLAYVSEVADHPEGHNLYEVAGVRRFFTMLDRHEWSARRVRNFYKFYEVLRFNGATGRQRYKLTPVQCFQFANIFGFRDEKGRRLTRTAYIFVPRKFSKTTSAASLAVYDMIFGDSNAQAYVGANSYPQAKICFDEIRQIMWDIDRKGSTFQVNREKISYKKPGHDSFIRCLTANARTQDGLNASLVIMDEYAQARNTAGKNGADLKNVLTSSMGVREEPLTVIITTASEVVDGPFANELEGVKKVLRGELENDTMFASVFMPDVDDEEDDPKTWAKVQPHLGVTVQPDFYEKEWQNAQMSAENMLAFRTKLLNVFCVNESKLWLPPDLIRSVGKPLDPHSLPEGTTATLAFDLSVRDDFSAVTLGIVDEESFTQHFKTWYILPRAGMMEHRNRALYERWERDGHLIVQDTEVIDYEAIADFILEITANLNVIAIGYDPFKSLECVNMLKATELGPVVEGFSQTKGNFTSAVQSFEVGVRTGHIYIDPNPINAFCFGNAVLVTDMNNNCKPMQRAKTDKIDGVITMLMSHKLFATTERYAY